MAQGSTDAVLGGSAAEIARHPQIAYQRWRTDSAPLVTDGGTLLVTRHDDVAHVLRHPELFAALPPRPLRPVSGHAPLDADAEMHSQVRAVLEPLLSPGWAMASGKQLVEIINELLDEYAYRHEIDFTTEFSRPLAARLLAMILGAPDSDVPDLLALSAGMLAPDRVTDSALESPAAHAHQARAVAAARDYFAQYLDARANSPADDLFSRLHEVRVDGVALRRDTQLHLCVALLLATIEPLSAALGLVFAYLAQHPPQRARVVDNPAVRRTIVEELLRWESPVMMVARAAQVDGAIGGCPVSAGQQVAVVLGAANTDDSWLQHAQDVLVERKVNPHLAFGGGSHRCLGSHVSRITLRVTLREWHRRIPDYRIKPGTELEYDFGLRTVQSLPLVLGRSA